VLEGEIAICTGQGLQETTEPPPTEPSFRRSSFADWFTDNRISAESDQGGRYLIDGEAATLRRNYSSFIFNSINEQTNPDYLLYGNIQMSYYTKCKDKKVSWAVVGKEELSAFLSSRPHLSHLGSLLNIRLSDMLAAQPLFKGFSPKQVC